VELRVGFPQAALASCTIAADGSIEALVAPETSPINASPWYAFEVSPPPETETHITLCYAEAGHRYHPWLRTGGGPWHRLDPARITVHADGRAHLRLPPLDGPTIVAAQPLDDPDRALAPFDQLARAGRLARLEAARSVDGDPIHAYLHRPPGAKGLLVFLTRQHPPERPGAVGFDHFAALLLSDTPLMQALRREVAILFVPVMNPDGIRRGHWRGNANGADLNRDWGVFRQPETAGTGALIIRLAADLPLLFAMDFHATRRDILYAPPPSPDRQDIGHHVARAFTSHRATAHIPIRHSHTPDAGTLKGWSLDRFGISGLTWEAGDNTPDEVVRAHAAATAELVAEAVLATLGQQAAPLPLAIPAAAQ
jgi:hypothetical protein